jgi:hypothetical protein
MRRVIPFTLLLLSVLLLGCGAEGDPPTATPDPQELDWPCEVPEGGAAPDSLLKIGCRTDYDLLASLPFDASIPGARSAKVILDLCADDLCESKQLYFQNSNLYPIHHDFASEHLSDPMLPLRRVPALSEFNAEYTKPYTQRRFLLGAVSYYEAPDEWALEIAPYDTSTPAMIEELYDAVRAQTYFGPILGFHPTSEGVAEQAELLPKDVKVTTTEEIYRGIEYQPLNLGESVGPIRFIRSVNLQTEYVTSRSIVVLDAVPNDITPVAGIITEEFQTPLSHINVLMRARGRPNMGLRSGRMHEKLAGLKDGDHVRLTVGAFDFDVQPVTLEESEAWWLANKPPPVTVPAPDLTVTDLRDIETVTEHTDTAPFVELENIQTAIRAFGGKASNYSIFATDPRVPHKKAFGIPVYYYDRYMRQNGFFERVATLQNDPEFIGDDGYRDAELQALRDDMMATDIDDEFKARLKAKLDADFPNRSMRFRSSTNAEDLNGFPCAGCYDSHTGDPTEHGGDQVAAASEAIRKTWATVWNLRTYDERQLNGIDHTQVCMALLVHTNFPAEEANGLAITDNIFDQSGNAPGFYVNVQEGGTFEVVAPPPGITSDSFLFQYSFPTKPIIYYTHSNVTIPSGADVLTTDEIHLLGDALAAINERFRHAYAPTDGGWWALEVDFKFDDEADPGGAPSLYIKQARPYPANKQK